MRYLHRCCAASLLLALMCVVAPADTLVLPNGLTAVVIEGAAGDVCGIHVALDIGPERVPPRKAGLRALVQQVLLSRIRQTMNEREDLAALKQEGSQGSAFSVETQEGHVEFMASVTSAQLPKMLEFLAGSIFDATWTEDDVVDARELIDRRVADPNDHAEPRRDAFAYFLRALRGDSVYTQPVMGTPETRSAITLTDIGAFYRSYYVPGLASVCVISPLPAKDTLELVRSTFGAYKTRQVAAPRPVVEAGTHSRVQIGAAGGLRAAVMVAGIPVPPPGTEGYAVAQVIHAALSGPGGLLAENADQPRRGFNRTPQSPAMLLPMPVIRTPYLAMLKTISPTALDQGRQEMLSRLDSLAHTPLSSAQLARAKTRATNALVLPMDDPLQAATAINRHFIVADEGPADNAMLSMIAAVTTEQIQQFAKQQLQEHAIGIVMPGT